jgi:flavin reductase (DIM6/NTAB) family NADH-FMN oxidoreductase RutF
MIESTGGSMQRKSIDISALNVQPHHLFHSQWLLLTAGDFAKDDFNTMTISWGALGTMWSQPFVFVAVRHSRYTFEFMEKYDQFTLSAFPASCQDALTLLGSHSGRDEDKIAESGLTPIASKMVSAPTFEEAVIVLECQKIYANDLDPDKFLDASIHNQYPRKDFHRIYYGKILKTWAVDSYIA